MILNVLASACPLLLCSIGALFTEYAGVLGLFMEGLITFSAFLVFFFTNVTQSAVLGMIITCVVVFILMAGIAYIIQHIQGQTFIAAIALNLLFSAIVSWLSTTCYGTRGVLTSSFFNFNLQNVQIVTVILSLFMVTGGIAFLLFTRIGLYIRITGSDSEVLLAKGVNPKMYRAVSWSIASIYAAVAGGLLAFRLSSFVPNISSGRGWMALAAVFLGRKDPVRIVFSVLIFCIADVFSANVQNFLQNVPSSIIISLPYIVTILMISLSKSKQ